MLGRYAEAAALDSATVTRMREVLGPGHPDVRRAEENPALDRRLLGERRQP